jgi:hypothetical protein
VGGELNAFTGKEYTCYHARVLDADVPLAIDVICDMVASSLIPEHEVDAERNVILEEIAMHDDDPDDVVHDAFVETLYGDSPLGRSITGSVDRSTTCRAGRSPATTPGATPPTTSSSPRPARSTTIVWSGWSRKAFEQAGALGDPGRAPAAPRLPGAGPQRSPARS